MTICNGIGKPIKVRNYKPENEPNFLAYDIALATSVAALIFVVGWILI